MINELVKKFPACCGTHRFMTLFTRARLCSISKILRMQPIFTNLFNLKIHLSIIHQWRRCFFSFYLLPQKCLHCLSNRIESTKCICFFNYIKSGNVFTETEARFLQNASTKNRPPDFGLTPNPASSATFAFLATRDSIDRTKLQFLSASYEQRTSAVKRDLN
jgi:hypothetical protein